MSTADVIRLLAHPPEPTDRDGQVALLRAACDEGLPVAIMCPTGQAVADARPGVTAVDRVPPRERKASQGNLPPELVTTDADTAVGWLWAYSAFINDPGIAVRVGVDAAARLLPRPGLLSSPPDGWVTAWRVPKGRYPPRLVSSTLATHSTRDPEWEREQQERARERQRVLDEEKAQRARERTGAERREREKFDAVPRPGGPKRLKSIRMHPDELGDYAPGGGAVTEGYYVVQVSPSMRHYFWVTIAPYGSGKLYARRLNHEMYTGRIAMHGKQKRKYPVEQCWEYACPQSHHAWMHQIATYGRLLTQDEAAFKEFGDLYGVCIRCEQTLTRGESIAVSCGEICAEHLGIAYPGKSSA